MCYMKPLVTLAVTLTILLIVSGIVMFFAQGYRIDIGNRNLEQTGILTVNSLPEGALIFLNEIPQDVTDNSIQGLKPGTYDLRLEKEGYQSWTRTVEISVGRVTQHTALLISLFPEIKPLTLTGVNNPQVSLDGQKIVYTTSQAQNNLPTQSGVWLLELTSRPFNIASRPTLLLTDTPTLPYSAAKISWGGDNQSLVLEMPDGEIFLYDLQAGQTRPLSPENKLILEEDWAQLAKRNEELLREQFDSEIRKELPGQETGGVWSPDQTKILYTQLKDGMREYHIIDLNPTEFSLPVQSVEDIKRYVPYSEKQEQNATVLWHANSMHLFIIETSGESQGSISILELDGENKTSLYNGRIINQHVFSHPDGNKILIHTNFTSDQAQSNLYSLTFN